MCSEGLARLVRAWLSLSTGPEPVLLLHPPRLQVGGVHRRSPDMVTDVLVPLSCA